MLLSSWKCSGFKKELNYLYCWTCLVFMRLVCLPTWPICLKVCQTSVPWQHLHLLSSSKENLQDASFLQVLLKTEAFWNSVPAKTQFVCTGLCQHYGSHILHRIFVKVVLSRSPSSLQQGQGAAPFPQPQPVAGPTVLLPWWESWDSRDSWGHLDEGLWLLGCLQVEQMAAGCESFSTQPAAHFWHKQF